MGGDTTAQTDLVLPGRLLPLAVTRTYNFADFGSGPLGPGWTHSYDWSASENGTLVTIKRGDGRRDQFTWTGSGYAAPLGVSDTLTKNGDGSFTLTTRNQVSYEFGTPPPTYSSLVLADSPAGYWRLGRTGSHEVIED